VVQKGRERKVLGCALIVIVKTHKVVNVLVSVCAKRHETVYVPVSGRVRGHKVVAVCGEGGAGATEGTRGHG
jgi:hypothetical protein